MHGFYGLTFLHRNVLVHMIRFQSLLSVVHLCLNTSSYEHSHAHVLKLVNSWLIAQYTCVHTHCTYVNVYTLDVNVHVI